MCFFILRVVCFIYLKNIKKRQENNGKKKADDLWRKQKALQQTLDELLNKLGRPTDQELDTAKQDAIRRKNLENANDELNKVKKTLEHMKSHPGNVDKHDLALLQAKEKQLLDLIKNLSIDESEIEYYDPVPVHHDYSKKSDFINATKQMKSAKKKTKINIDLHDIER